jgi:hypothetical protein
MMKGSIAVALATGTLVAVAYGGFAMAVEAENPGDAEPVVTATAEPEAASGEEASGDAPSPDAPADETDENGLVCVLVPIETEPVEGEAPEGDTTEDGATADEPTAVDPSSIEELLAANTIECSGTGNERSSEVALLPRYLAHSDVLKGAEKGAAIAAWAKTHANKKSGDEEVPEDDGATEDSESSAGAPASPGKSGDAPGHSGSRPGNGKGR